MEAVCNTENCFPGAPEDPCSLITNNFLRLRGGQPAYVSAVLVPKAKGSFRESVTGRRKKNDSV